MKKNHSKLILQSVCFSMLFSSQAFSQECGFPTYEDCCDPAPCVNRFWVDADYIYWKIQNSPESVPLVVSGPFVEDGSPVLDTLGSSVVLGDHHIETKWRSGGRFSVGYWLDDAQKWGVEANYFFLPSERRTRTVSSTGLAGSDFLSVPFFDVTTGLESSGTIADPGSFSGLATLRVKNDMQNAELNILGNFSTNCSYKLGFLAGFRYWNFRECLDFTTDSPLLGVADDVFTTYDSFRTENNFYGGQVGVCFDYVNNGFLFNVKGKVALGAMCEEVSIFGDFITNEFDGFGAPQAFIGGYFAQPSNIGKHKRTTFSVIPEADVNIGYQLTDNFSIKVGYTFIYVSRMLFAGKQIDRDINPTQSSAIALIPDPILVGEASPRERFKESSLWVQGINVGFNWQF